MSDAQQTGTPASATSFVIADSVREQYPDVVALVLGSESMNDEERQYWFGIMPVMNKEQIDNLRNILVNERDQLAAIDAKYAAQNAPTLEDISKIGDERRSSREQLQNQETAARTQEETESEELLKKMQEI